MLLAAVDKAMIYTMPELEALTGLTARTIRDYIRHGFLDPPRGRGPGATYNEEQMLRVVTIARMRAQKQGWDVIANRLNSWSIAKLRKFVEETEPKSPPTAPAASAPGAPEQKGEPASREVPPRHPEADTTTELDVLGGSEDGPLGSGTRVVVSSLLPGLLLMMNENAAPLVKRVAREIVSKYRVRQ